MKKTFYSIILFLSVNMGFGQTFDAAPETDRVVVVEGDTLIYAPEIPPVYQDGEVVIDTYFRRYFGTYSRTKTRKFNKVIWVSFVIRSSGGIGATNIISSEKPEMSDKVTKALKAMFWTPAVNKGKKVATIGDFYFYFD